MNQKDFLDFCQKQQYDSNNLKLFKLALDFIKPLKEKKRIQKNDNFFKHNLRVGLVLADNKVMPEVVLAGLLHSLTSISDQKKIKELFGKEVLALILGSEEVKRIKYQNHKLEAEALRKIILTTLKDVRVIIIQLANKLDNLESVEVLPKPEQQRIAAEALEFYAPLAYRLGLDKIKAQLETFAFKTINPRKYKEINEFLRETQEEREKNVKETIELVKKIAHGNVDIVKIKGRPKQVYSIYKKIKDRQINLNDFYDLSGIRVIVPEVKDCYHLLGLLHEKFEPLEGRLKDYIANPKPNFYRSIHTGIKLPGGKIAEIQIRTPDMEEFAEEGIAAHWRYKGLSSEQLFEKKVGWLKNILELNKDIKNKEFLETAKVDIFGDHIYCYTPKGDVKELPKGSTLLDFAFLIHEEVGAKTIGGRVNGRFVPLRKELSQGDVVEIITNKNQRPRRTWIKIVKSGKSRQKIRKYLKQYENLPALHYRDLKPKITEEQGLLAESEDFPNAACLLAKCCYPLPGENIVGIITKRRTISVHSDKCRFALREENRWVPVNWKGTFNQKIHFHVSALERSGLLADLLHTIATAGFEVKEAKAKLIDSLHAQCSFLVIPKDLEHLKSLVVRVGKIKGVKKIYFE